MGEETKARPEPPCGLPKQGNNCANKSAIFCAKCGWNPEEQARRKALPLTKNGANVKTERKRRMNKLFIFILY